MRNQFINDMTYSNRLAATLSCPHDEREGLTYSHALPRHGHTGALCLIVLTVLGPKVLCKMRVRYTNLYVYHMHLELVFNHLLE